MEDELTLQCTDPYLQSVEWYLRTNIYKHKHMPADMMVSPFVPVQKVIHSTGSGISVDEQVMATDIKNHIISHKYNDVLSTEDDLAKLYEPIVTYDENETLKRYNLIGDILDDIIPVKLTGVNVYGFSPWDDIARYRGVTNLLRNKICIVV